MNMLLGVLTPDARPVLGPFGVAEESEAPSSFTPSGDEWTAAQAVYTARSATGYIWKAVPESLRVSGNDADGVSATNAVGFANDWRNLGASASAAQESGDRRPTYNVVDSVDAIVLTGEQDTTDNQRLALPVMDPTQGTWIIVARLASTANANQTAFEAGPFRLMAQMTGYTGPTVRVGSGVQYEFGLSSMYQRWSAFVVQCNKATSNLRMLYDGGSWTEQTPIASWLDAPAATYEYENYIGRNYYDPSAPFGAPMNGAFHCAVYIDKVTDLTQADIQALVDLAVLDTGITFTVPTLPDTDPGEVEEGYTDVINVSTAGELATAISTAAPGDDIVLADGTYGGDYTLSANGTAAAPIRIRAKNRGLALMTGLLTLSGDYTRANGLKWDSVSGTSQIALLSGDYAKIQRCYFIDCTVGTFGGSVNRGIVAVDSPADHCTIEYCEFSGWETYSAVKLRTASSTGATNAHVHHNYFHDTALSQAISHGGDGTRAGTDHVSNHLIEYNYINNVKSSSGIAIQIKGSWLTVQQNTVVNSGYCFNRHGYSCDWIANTMVNSGGPWGCGKDHRFIGNLNSKAGTYTSIGCSTGTHTMDTWTPSGSNQPCGEDILFSQNTGPLNLQMWNLAAHTLNARNLIIEAHSGAISYGSSSPARTPTLPTYTTRAPTVSAPTRVVLSASDVGPNAGATIVGGVSIANWAANPWDASSAARIPIGSSLTRSTSTRLATYYSNGNVVEINAENGYGVPTVLATELDPIVTVTKVGGLTNDLPITCRIPVGFGTTNEATCVIQPDGRICEFYGLNRTALTASIGWDRAYIFGKGHSTSTGVRIGVSAAYCSAMFGVLPVDILENEALNTETAIQWTLHIALPAGRSGHVDDLLSHSFQLPACGGDATAGEVANNTGPFPYGARFTFATGFDYNTAVTTAATAAGISNATSIRMAKMVCAATYNYGLVVIDEGNSFAFRASRAFTTLQRKVDLKEILRRVLPSNINWITNGVSGATGLVSPGGVLSGVPGTIASPYGGGTGRASNTGYTA